MQSGPINMMGFGGQMRAVESLVTHYSDGPVKGRYLLMGVHAATGMNVFLSLGMAFLYLWHIFQHIYIVPGWVTAILAGQIIISLLGMGLTLGMSPFMTLIFGGRSNHWMYGSHYNSVDRHSNDAYNWSLFTGAGACFVTNLASATAFIWVWALHGSIIESRTSWELSLTTAVNVLEALPALEYWVFFVAAALLNVLAATIMIRTGHTWFAYSTHNELEKSKGY